MNQIPKTDSIEAHILNITEQIRNFEKEKGRMIRQTGELWNLIGLRLDTLVYYKLDYIQNMSPETPTEIAAIEFHAYVLNRFISILEKLRAGWNTYLGFLKMAYVDILKHVWIWSFGECIYVQEILIHTVSLALLSKGERWGEKCIGWLNVWSVQSSVMQIFRLLI